MARWVAVGAIVSFLGITTIADAGIANRDGVLRYNGRGNRDTFQESCVRISISQGYLSALCRRFDGRWNWSSIRVE